MSNGRILIDPHFCLEIWGTEYSKIKEICLLAEKLGYYGFYYGESLADIDLDCWTIISNLSAVTQMIKLGPVITYLLCPVPVQEHLSISKASFDNARDF